MSDEDRLPVTICWHCDRALDAATPAGDEVATPAEGSVSLCIYCGAIAIFGPDLRLIPPTEEQLNELEDVAEFRSMFARFSFARQFVMIRESLMRDREDPD